MGGKFNQKNISQQSQARMKAEGKSSRQGSPVRREREENQCKDERKLDPSASKPRTMTPRSG